MKFLKFNQLAVSQEGKTDDLGDHYILPSDIVSVKHIWDKHEVTIPNCCLITMKNQLNTVVKGEPEAIVKQIEESALV